MPMRMPMYSTISISHLAPAPIHYHNNSHPSRQRSASTHSSPAGHRETQPFVTVIQRSTDDPSNSRETTSLPTLNQIPTPSTHFPICSLLTCNPSDNPEFLQEESLPPSPLSPFRPEKPAREACAVCHRTLQEGSCFLGGGNLRCFKNSRCLSGFRREFENF